MGINDCINLGEKIYNSLSSKSLRDEASKQIIAQVTNSEKLGIFEKQIISDAIIYNTNMLKTKNKADVLQKAINILEEKDPELLSGVKNIDDEWLLHFFDCCENTTDEAMKTIWAKILTSECEKKGRISKRLLDILRIIDKTSAEKFEVLCAHSLKMYLDNETVYLSFILPRYRLEKYENEVIDNFFSTFDVKQNDILELVSIGLIEESNFGYVFQGNELKIDYFGSQILIKQIDGKQTIRIGNYQFTKCGLELVRTLYDDIILAKDITYIPFLIEYYKTYNAGIYNSNPAYSVEILSN